MYLTVACLLKLKDFWFLKEKLASNNVNVALCVTFSAADHFPKVAAAASHLSPLGEQPHFRPQ